MHPGLSGAGHGGEVLKPVYLDHSASTQVRPEVLAALLPYLGELFGNPSSAHRWAREAQEGLERARTEVAGALDCGTDEVIFTSGGTESDNLAVLGIALGAGTPSPHVITSSVEHKAVLGACHALERAGGSATFLPVDGAGLVSADDLRAALRPETVLVSLMHANNETGTIQDLPALAAVAREAGVPMHSDAVGSFGKVDVGFDSLGVDALSISGHKFYGPKGVGVLALRRGIHLAPQQHGGGHEGGRRAGTENVPGIVGLGFAARLAAEELERETERLGALRRRLEEGILGLVSRVAVNGHPTRRLPTVASISFRGADGGRLLRELDRQGIAVSTGSACLTGSPEPSHVLAAMGIDQRDALGTIRFSLGRGTTGDDIDHVLGILPGLVGAVRG